MRHNPYSKKAWFVKMKKFKRIYIEIINTCNLQCTFCPPTIRTKAYMTLESFEEVLMKIKGYGQFIYLHIKGEPLMHPDICGILKLCEVYGIKVNITTNGTLIEKQSEQLLTSQSLRQVSISLQSFEAVDDKEAFEGYMKHVMDFVNKVRLHTNIIIELRLWNYDREKIGTKVYIKNQWALSYIKQSLELKVDIKEELPIVKGVKLVDNVYLSQSCEFEWPDMKKEVISQSGSCYGLSQQVGILVNGDVVPCCLDSDGDVVLGNIHKMSFEDILSSNRAQDIIEGFRNRQIVEALCQRCGFRERFN